MGAERVRDRQSPARPRVGRARLERKPEQADAPPPQPTQVRFELPEKMVDLPLVHLEQRIREAQAHSAGVGEVSQSSDVLLQAASTEAHPGIYESRADARVRPHPVEHVSRVGCRPLAEARDLVCV